MRPVLTVSDQSSASVGFAHDVGSAASSCEFVYYADVCAGIFAVRRMREAEGTFVVYEALEEEC